MHIHTTQTRKLKSDSYKCTATRLCLHFCANKFNGMENISRYIIVKKKTPTTKSTRWIKQITKSKQEMNELSKNSNNKKILTQTQWTKINK